MIIDATQRIVACPKCNSKFKVPPQLNAPNFICPRCKNRFANPFQVSHPGVVTRRERSGPKSSPSTSGLDSFTAELRDAMVVEPQKIQQAVTFAKDNGCKIYEAIVRLNFLTWERLHEFLSKHPGITPFKMEGYSVDRDVLQMIPRELVQQHMVVPVTRLGQLLTVAMVCPLDMEAVEAVRTATGMKIRPVLCSHTDFQVFVQKYYRTPDLEPNATPGAFGVDTGESIHGAIGGQTAAQAVLAGGNGAAAATGSEQDLTERYLARIREMDYLEISARHASAVATLDETSTATLRQLLAVVSSAPTLAAILLATTNSRAYGVEGKVDSLAMALTLLGVEGTKVVVANAPQMNPMTERMLSPLFHHARRVSVMAANLAGKTGHIIGNVAQVAAVLHSVGSFVLGAADPEKYKKIDRNLWGAARATAEKQVFGLHHGEVADRLFQEWRLPEILAIGSARYLDPSSAGDYADFAGLINLAVRSLSPDGEVIEDIPPEARTYCEWLGMTPEQVSRCAYQAANV